MTVNTKTLDTTNWQHARGTFGGVVTEVEDVEQCIGTICGCEKGTVVYNPNLGLPLKQFMDRPVNEVIPQMRQIIKIELESQEPRITVDSVSFRADENGFLITKITYIFENTVRTKEVKTQWQTI